MIADRICLPGCILLYHGGLGLGRKTLNSVVDSAASTEFPTVPIAGRHRSTSLSMLPLRFSTSIQCIHRTVSDRHRNHLEVVLTSRVFWHVIVQQVGHTQFVISGVSRTSGEAEELLVQMCLQSNSGSLWRGQDGIVCMRKGRIEGSGTNKVMSCVAPPPCFIVGVFLLFVVWLAFVVGTGLTYSAQFMFFVTHFCQRTLEGALKTLRSGHPFIIWRVWSEACRHIEKMYVCRP